jgi:hypothetical protein
MKDNVFDASDMLNQRGEKIELTIKKADNLRSESKSYFSDVLIVLNLVKKGEKSGSDEKNKNDHFYYFAPFGDWLFSICYCLWI